MSEKRPYYFVVYGAKVGRTEPGIYQRQVTFDGDLAFVHPKGDAQTAPRRTSLPSRTTPGRSATSRPSSGAHAFWTSEG